MRSAILLAAMVLLAGCVGQAQQASESDVAVDTPEDITLTTTDNIKIAATYYPAEGEKGVILIHMLGKTKDDWKEFAPELQKKGYAAIAIDLRGHGGSQLNRNDFIESDFNRMMFDLIAAGQYMKDRNKKIIAPIGASIGANLGLLYANSEDTVSTAVLLSPGLNYRGVDAESAAGNARVPMLIMVGEQDSYSFTSSKTIAERSSAMLKVYGTDAHGTDLLKESDVKDQILSWLEKYFVNQS